MYKHFAAKMYSVIVTYVKDREVAQDILHDSFMKVFKKIHQFQTGSNIEVWVRRVVVNTTIDHLRKTKRLRASDVEELSIAGDGETPLEKLQVMDLREIINMLPSGAKVVFNLYANEGYTHKEIAERLDISTGTSKSQYSRARNILKNLVNQYYKG